jgi:hypothetical protein
MRNIVIVGAESDFAGAVSIPDSMSLVVESAAWRAWYRNEYVPNNLPGCRIPFVNFTEWLKFRGAVEADVEVFLEP